MNSKRKETICDLEELSSKLGEAVNCLEAVHETMTAGNAEAEHYTDALFFCWVSIKGYSDELKATVKRAFEQAKEELHNGKAN